MHFIHHAPGVCSRSMQRAHPSIGGVLGNPRRIPLVAALFLSVASCGPGSPAVDNHPAEAAHGEEGGDVIHFSERQTQSAGIKMATAERRAGSAILELPAEVRLDPDRVARVSTPISGVVSELRASEGDRVSRGQTLAVIASRELADLKADYMDAATSERLSQSEAKRAESLWEQDAISESAVETARAGFARVRAEREAAETKLHAIDIEHDVLDQLDAAEDGSRSHYRLTSPISGQVIQRLPTLGEAVGSGENADIPLFVIADASVVWADIAVYRQDVGKLSLGADVALIDDDGEELGRGEIVFISPIVDEASRTTTARIVVDNADGRLMPGQFLKASVNIGAAAATIRIPESAVQTVKGRASVFTPHKQGFAVQPVTPGRVANGETEIVAGLAEGEAYVAEGAFTLKAELEKSAFGDGHGH